eukprot:14909_1
MSTNDYVHAREIGVEALSLIPYVFVIPLTIYWNTILWKHRSAMFVQKRSVFILFGMNMSLLVVIITSVNSQIGIMYNLGIFLSRTLPMIIAWTAMLFFLITKNWLIYWRFYWQYYTLQLSWQRLINSKVINNPQHNNKFVKYNHKYGRIAFTAQVCGTVALFCAVMNILFYALSEYGYVTLGRVFATFAMLSMLFLVILYVIIVCKTPVFQDTFFIHWESKIIAKILLSTMLITLALVTTVLLVQVHEKSYLYLAIFLFPILAISLCIMSYVSTMVIINKNTNNSSGASANNDEKHIMTELAYSTHKIASSIDSNGISIDVNMILADEQCVNLFMRHLSKEFSMELVLSVIEMSQFQEFLFRNDLANEITEVTRNKFTQISFAANIPLSEIIESDKNAETKALMIYKKYIENGSQFEVNIAHSLRNVMSMHMDVEQAMDVNAVIVLLEECKMCMKTLLLFSLTRFKNTPQFEEIKHIFDTDNGSA